MNSREILPTLFPSRRKSWAWDRQWYMRVRDRAPRSGLVRWVRSSHGGPVGALPPAGLPPSLAGDRALMGWGQPGTGYHPTQLPQPIRTITSIMDTTAITKRKKKKRKTKVFLPIANILSSFSCLAIQIFNPLSTPVNIPFRLDGYFRKDFETRYNITQYHKLLMTFICTEHDSRNKAVRYC